MCSCLCLHEIVSFMSCSPLFQHKALFKLELAVCSWSTLEISCSCLWSDWNCLIELLGNFFLLLCHLQQWGIFKILGAPEFLLCFLMSSIHLDHFYGKEYIFTASALWAVYKSICQSVHPSVCSLLRYPFNVLLPPLPKVGCPTFLEIQNSWGKVMERSGLIFENFY